jgi:hypothetical protein
MTTQLHGLVHIPLPSPAVFDNSHSKGSEPPFDDKTEVVAKSWFKQRELSVENTTEAAAKPWFNRKWAERGPVARILIILLSPVLLAVGLLYVTVSVYPRFYQFMGILFVLISGFGFAAQLKDYATGEQFHDAKQMGLWAIGGFVLCVVASIMRKRHIRSVGFGAW